jgi:hypothetical protein
LQMVCLFEQLIAPVRGRKQRLELADVVVHGSLPWRICRLTNLAV